MYFILGNTFKRLVVCFNVDNILSVDVVVESLTREHYRQQFLLDLSIVLFGVCHGSACVAYWLAILHGCSAQARPRPVCLDRYAFSHVVQNFGHAAQQQPMDSRGSTHADGN